jgi:hypothetical protein
MRRTRIAWKALYVPLMLMLLVLEVAACGGSAESTSSRVASTRSSSSSRLHPRHAVGDYDNDDYEAGADVDDDDSVGRLDHDGDSDSRGVGLYDGDDTDMLEYRHSASVAETRAVAALVKRYLAAAAAADGTQACSMILASIANVVPTILGGVGEPPYSRGRTCAEVVSKVFHFYRAQLVAEARVLRVVKVGVKGDKGLAVLAARAPVKFPVRVIALQRESGGWKIDGVLDQEQS